MTTTTEAIWRDHHARLAAFVRKKVGHEQAAEDVLQNIFLKIHAGLPSLKDSSRLPAWLYRIAGNAIADHYRSRRPAEELPPDLEPEPDSDNRALRELSECLMPMIEQLPPAYREAIVLSEIKGMTQREVAERQGLSLSGAKSRVQRGRAMLKKMLTDCCRFEFDRRGGLTDFERREPCDDCEGDC